MLEVGFSVRWVMIGWLEEILLRMLLVLFDRKFCGVSLLWCLVLCWVMLVKLVLIFMFFIVLMFISVCVSLVFRWLKIGLFRFGGMFLVIMVIFVLIEFWLWCNWFMQVFSFGILFGLGLKKVFCLMLFQFLNGILIGLSWFMQLCIWMFRFVRYFLVIVLVVICMVVLCVEEWLLLWQLCMLYLWWQVQLVWVGWNRFLIVEQFLDFWLVLWISRLIGVLVVLFLNILERIFILLVFWCWVVCWLVLGLCWLRLCCRFWVDSFSFGGYLLMMVISVGLWFLFVVVMVKSLLQVLLDM